MFSDDTTFAFRAKSERDLLDRDPERSHVFRITRRAMTTVHPLSADEIEDLARDVIDYLDEIGRPYRWCVGRCR